MLFECQRMEVDLVASSQPDEYVPAYILCSTSIKLFISVRDNSRLCVVENIVFTFRKVQLSLDDSKVIDLFVLISYQKFLYLFIYLFFFFGNTSSCFNVFLFPR